MIPDLVYGQSPNPSLPATSAYSRSMSAGPLTTGHMFQRGDVSGLGSVHSDAGSAYEIPPHVGSATELLNNAFDHSNVLTVISPEYLESPAFTICNTLPCTVTTPSKLQDVITSVLSVVSTPSTPINVVIGNKALIKAESSSAGDLDHRYVTGKRYTVKKEDGSCFEGVWDGKYLVAAASEKTSCSSVQTSKCSPSPAACSVDNVSKPSPSRSVSPTFPTLEKNKYQNGSRKIETDILECHVALDKLDPDPQIRPAKRLKTDLGPVSALDKSRFYGRTEDSEPWRPRSTRCQNRPRRNIEPLDTGDVIHIDEDEDDEVKVIGVNECTNSDVVDSDGRMNDGGALIVSAPLKSVMFGQIQQTANMVQLFKRKLVLIKGSDTRGSNLLNVDASDISAIRLQLAISADSPSKIFVNVKKSCRTRLCDFFHVQLNDRDESLERLILFVIPGCSVLEQVENAVGELSSRCSEVVEDDSTAFEMECQDVSSVPDYMSSAMNRQKDDCHIGSVAGSSKEITAHPVEVDELARPPIHSVSTHALNSLHEYDECGQDEDEDASQELQDTSSSSEMHIVVPLGFNSEIVKLFTYPPPPAVGGITVTNEDLFCLNDDEFLNDVIIEFYIKYLYNEILTPAEREKTHIFNTFFYGQLTKEPKDSCAPSGLSLAQMRHSQVKRWTKHVDLFAKDFIIVPINEDSHWYLAIICFPGLVGMKTVPDMIPPSVRKNSSNGNRKQTTMDTVESILDVPAENKNPCILIFDSLKNGAMRWNVSVVLREYLQVEWNLKKAHSEGPKSFEKPLMKGATPGCPQQLNSSDCGVYVLHYIENFFRRPLNDFSLPIRYLNNWFPKEEVLNKRREIRKLILSLTAKLNPSIKYDPKQDGCDADDEGYS